MATGYEKSQYEIPQSRGMPPLVRYLFGIGLVVIFAMGFLSVHFGGEFHVWPVTDTIKAVLSGSFP
jgi:hypothetical protein